MLYVLVAIAGLLVGAAAVYLVALKQAQSDLVAVRRDRDLLTKRIVAVYETGFAPYGMHPDILKDAFNDMWNAVGKEPKGIPS